MAAASARAVRTDARRAPLSRCEGGVLFVEWVIARARQFLSSAVSFVGSFFRRRFSFVGSFFRRQFLLSAVSGERAQV